VVQAIVHFDKKKVNVARNRPAEPTASQKILPIANLGNEILQKTHVDAKPVEILAVDVVGHERPDVVREYLLVRGCFDEVGVARLAQAQYIQLHLVVIKEPRLSNKSA
jgi:hypothetical protein